jgi:Carboxypeptidase regulatory-like domain
VRTCNYLSIDVVSLVMQRLLLFATLLLIPALTYACTCAGPSPVCSAPSRGEVILRGRVVEQILISPADETVENLDGTASAIHSPGYYRVRFSVLEMFAGELRTQEIDILTNEQSSVCGFSFVTGAEYIVFASANQQTNELWTSHCTRTHELVPGKEDADVSWLRGLAALPRVATIYGTVFPASGSTGPNPLVTIDLRGSQSRSAVPDQNGRYAFPNLSPGDYTVSAVMPTGFAIEDSRTVTLVEKGCSQIDFRPRYDGHIRGVVTDSDDRPLPDIFMALQRRDSHSATGFTEIDLKNTGFDGRYDFAPIPPGDYLVSANHLGPSLARPYPRFYYGNTESDADAATIHLTASGTVDGINVKLPNAWKAVTVHARVQQPDGTPAISANVCAYDLNYLYSSDPPRANADVQGRATLSLYEGRTYYLVATISGGTQQRCAGPLKFVAREGATLGAITIEHNWGNCLAQLDSEFQAPR